MTVSGCAEKGFTVTNKRKVNAKVYKRKESLKVDLLAGAKLQLLEGEKMVDSWTTTEEHDVSTVLLPGKTYTLHEVSAPKGYEVAKDITIKVDDDGEISVNGTVTNSITMIDLKTSSNSSSSGSSSSASGSASVKTGDDTPVMMWLMILLISMAGICAAGVFLKRRRTGR